MPSGPVGTCWQTGTWPDTAWEADSWGSGVTPTCDYPSEDNVRLGVSYAFGTMTGTFDCPGPPVISVTSSPFALINSLIVARVAQALNISTDFVRPVANDDYAMFETENLFAYIRTFGPAPVDPTLGGDWPNFGAGRYNRVVGRRIRVYVYTRSGVDLPGGDEVALQGNDPTQTVDTPPTMPGQFVAEEVVLNALDDWFPAVVLPDTTVRVLTVGPLHWVNSADGPPVRKAENEEGMVRSHLDFQVVYSLAIEPVEPSPDTIPVPNQ